ncbi:MAG: pyridoxal-phosphate dependent enzyme [Ilumatobacter sp.]|nr:pyridoxal-phosphate dependent enzyme [Ilumatobacter sp.]
MSVTRAGVVAAAANVAPHVRHTPCMTVEVPLPGSAATVPVVLKLESLQVTGSFKPRGAVHSLLSNGAPEVVACSGGNHGLAVAWAAQRLGRRATVVVPVSAAATKVAAMRACGAEVVQHGDIPAEAFVVAESIVAERGLPLVHPYDQVPTIEGQGTLGLELLADAPQVTHWLVAVGGGGFPAGVALALDGSGAVVVPVEPEGCPSLYEAQRAGGPVPTKAEGIARTSLGPPSLGDLAWDVLRDRVPACRLVTDEAIAVAQQWLWQSTRLVAEPGGATALAALLSGAWEPPPGATVGAVICGGNADHLPG